MEKIDEQQRVLGRILAQPADEAVAAAIEAAGGTSIRTGETFGLDTGGTTSADRNIDPL